MSAYIVDKATIDAIVTWATDRAPRRSITVKTPEGANVQSYGGHCLLDELDRSLIGQLLWDENFKSVNYRYRENETSSRYVFKRVTSIQVEHKGKTVWRRSVFCVHGPNDFLG